jgi:membrane protease YdiL (CAAX protease family)
MVRMWALPLIWIGSAIAAYVYSLQVHIPLHLVTLALPAFLLEATFYYTLGVESWRVKLERLPPATVALLLTLSAATPYCAASLAFGFFRWQSLAAILGLAGVAAFWYVVLPHKASADLLFILFMAAVFLANLERHEYIDPYPKLTLSVLGKVMWIRTGAFAMLSVRRMQGVGFGFWPKSREWMIGAIYFALMLPVATAVSWLVGFASPHAPSPGWDRITVLTLGTFFGTLWVLALGEEFFFRGLLQQWLGQWLRSEWFGLALASVLFGLAHLWFHAFPNWHMVAMASVAGIFYGFAFRQARSIRASMVTHALTVTAWKLFFS